MLQIFDKRVELIEGSSTHEYSGFSHKKRFVFPNPFDSQNLRLTNFIEREHLKTKGISSNYWTAFDKEYLNITIRFLKKIGFLKLLNHPKIGNLLSSIVSKENNKNCNEHIGLTAQTGKHKISMILTSDYETTASCTIAFLKQVMSDKYNQKGVVFPFEVFAFDNIKSDIEEVIEVIEWA